MARDTKDWNYDRIRSAHAQMVDASHDMMMCLQDGEVVDVVRDRMVNRLRDAADDLAKLRLSHD